jgi:hypothetical protein
MFYYKGIITKLKDNEIFVFGSNLSGIHGAGAAREAMLNYEAQWGVGVGFTGKTYAIPTKDEEIFTLELEEIQPYVRAFKAAANMLPKTTFLVTKIGCGLAGYTDADIAPMFQDSPLNCVFHEDWRKYIDPK